MKKCYIPLASAMGLAAITAQAKQPNIVLFMVDDMGWQDTSVPFADSTTKWNRIYHTPNMERLAAKGVMFTRAYASAVSSPTRTTLMTGMNPAAHRVTNWTLERGQSPDAPKGGGELQLPEWNVNGLQPLGAGIERSVEALTLPQVLQAAGYHTIHCGKAHWGARTTPGQDPRALGFDVNIAGFAAGGPASYLADDNYGHDSTGKAKNLFSIPGLEKYWQSGLFLTEALTREALAAVDTAQKPFFLYLSHYAIHVPLNKDDRYYEKYRQAGLDDSQARYAGLIEGMDKSLGDVLDYLDKKGVADNTIVIFMSDNGGLSQHGRSGAQDRHNTPLNNGKGSAYEGGVRVPMMVYWPGVTAASTRCAEPVEIADFMPTITQMAGVKKLQTPQQQDGVSFIPLIQGKPWKHTHRSLVWHFPNRWISYGNPAGKGYGTYSSILKNGLKLIWYYDYELTELYDLNKDMAETTNVADQTAYAAQRKALERELTQKLKGWNAQLPRKSDGARCRYPDGSTNL